MLSINQPNFIPIQFEMKSLRLFKMVTTTRSWTSRRRTRWNWWI